MEAGGGGGRYPPRRERNDALMNLPMTLKNSAWMDDASCGKEDPKYWMSTPEDESTKDICENVKIAVGICGKCPVQTTCLSHALRYHEVGIWGGTTDIQRGLMRKNRMA